MAARFHCERGGRKKAKKSKHRVLETCAEVQQVLALNPAYGQEIPGTNGLRKMRLRVPGLNVGKSGGYRLIYRYEVVDEVPHIVLLETYFKGDKEDLTKTEYQELSALAEEILSNPFDYDWEDFPDADKPKP
jgi:mRNA-degrading endonuclease RelE of RelBE toxin-antitoxin system